MNKTIKCILAIITGNILYKYYCPYCNYRTDSYEDMRDHLTSYHWISTPGVDEIMKEMK